MARNLKACVFCHANMPTVKMQCPSCRMWQGNVSIKTDDTILLSDVSEVTEERILTGPWDHAWGGGLLGSRVSMIGGGPGAGKSTLMLQISDAIAGIKKHETLYVAIEENGGQIKSRAQRLKLPNMGLIRLMPLGSHGDIGEILLKHKPCLAVVDSISKMTADLEEQCTIAERLKDYAMNLNIPILSIVHISQEADFAGKVKLQHAVDALFTFYAADDGVRSLFVEKNRDGAAQVRLAFGMSETGLYPILCEVCKHNRYACTCDESE